MSQELELKTRSDCAMRIERARTDARLILEEAERKASRMISEAQFAVATHRRDYNLVELSRDAALWQITTVKDALTELLKVEQAEAPRK